MCTGQLVTTALFAIFSTDNIRDASPLLCHRSPSRRHGPGTTAPDEAEHPELGYTTSTCTKKNTYMVQRNSWEPQLSHSHSWGQTRGRLLHTLTSCAAVPAPHTTAWEASLTPKPHRPGAANITSRHGTSPHHGQGQAKRMQ